MTTSRSRALVTAAIGALLALPGAIFAHHSTSEYDQSEMVEVEGIVAQKFWKNPHVIFHIATTQGGQEVEWVIEGSSVSGQNRRGITSDLINEGDRVTVAGYASTRRENNMNMRHILLANGQELMLSGNAEPRWPRCLR